ncbi:T9SS type A sorting domain-containing protein [Hymenobacter algoricola]|uniref:Big-1 domain-containing protein n=1 Tax=Hymenobacter algoricola TaxID=486267 RepID=A0ABP7NXB8_9BACT
MRTCTANSPLLPEQPAAPLSVRRRPLAALLALLITLLSLGSSGGAYAAADSKGTDFWLSFPGNYASGATLTLFVTGDVATTGTVAIAGLGFTATFSVTPGTVTSVPIPTNAQLFASNTIENKGIHVTAAQEITVYGLNRQQFTTDAYLGLPTDVLGTDYISLGYTSLDFFDPNVGTQFNVVATVDGTVVTITPSVTTDGRTANVPYNITLNQGQTYLLKNTGAYPTDLSGSFITSTQPIAVFGGNKCANVPHNHAACDHLVEQLPPTTAWGKNFVSVPLKTRLNGDTFRFLASVNGTQVRVNGTLVATLNRGQWHERIVNGSAQIVATQPILVAQYSNGTTFDNVTSDPFMMLVPPFEQFLGSYTVTTPASGFSGNYINVVAPAAAVGTVTFDGVAIPAGSFSAIGSSGFSGAQLTVGLGSHTINGSGFPIGAFVYGFDQADSYGYPGGMSLSPVATVSTVTLDVQGGTGQVGTSHCITATARDQFNNPVVGVRVDFTVSGVNSASGFENTNASGVATFCYTGLNPGTDNVTGAVGSVSQTAQFIWTGGCSIVLSAALTKVTCPGGTTGVIDLSVANATAPITYIWSNGSSTQDLGGLPVGTYTVNVTDANNCTATAAYTITQQPDVAPPTALAKNIAVQLNATGTATITPAMVDNGSSDNCSFGLSLSKTSFNCSNVGANTVTLTATDNSGNTASATAVVTVLSNQATPIITSAPYPGLQANTGGIPTNLYIGYGNQSVQLNATTPGAVSYQWTPAAGLVGPNLPNPIYSVTNTPGDYTYTVKVTNQYGCSATKSVTIRVVDARCGNYNERKVLVCRNGQVSCVLYPQVAAILSGPGQNSIGICPAPASRSTVGATVGSPNELAIYPNPAKEQAILSFRVAADTPAQLRVYNQLGVLVATLYDGKASAGQLNTMTLSSQDLASGVYQCRLLTGGQSETSRLVIVK